MDAPCEHAWTFDVMGLVHLPAALSAGQLAEAQQQAHTVSSISAAANPLRAHPALLDLLPVLACGETKYHLDQPPRLLPSVNGAWLNSDAIEDMKRLGYDIVVGQPTGDYSFRRAEVRGFRVLWVLDDCSGLGTVTASHKSSLPAPSPKVAAQMKALVPVGPLRAGDLVIAAATTLLSWTNDGSNSKATAPRILELIFCRDTKIGQEGPAASPKSTTLADNLTNDDWTFADDR
eukprot:COSAG02_NODE_471_length_21662_cov_70.510040_9_plen_233_part_00